MMWTIDFSIHEQGITKNYIDVVIESGDQLEIYWAVWRTGMESEGGHLGCSSFHSWRWEHSLVGDGGFQ